ncbi:ABC transporter permease [Acetonema longum]|uniref:ABC transmembrane type-1 domain-containing protein n=1 Tax=Acetonema longum DSM 6540 TaxID=1009370 RepID=F7NEQ6_9FIRM|nr:ABC transporter permease [Acetonema longum]EGO65467.1 hypothetical protein ALO_02606 [Acetonema longum DSM 6540]
MSKNALLHIGWTLLRLSSLLVAVSILAFGLVISSPIDPVDAYVGSESGVSQEQRQNVAAYWGLDKPPGERYFIWARNMLAGDMGTSITYRLPVSQVIAERFQTSLALMGTAWVLSGLLGFILGVVAGVYRGSVLDRGIKTFCLILSSTPAFWLGLLLLTLFAVRLEWFPIALAAPIGKLSGEVTLGERIHHLILPSLTLSITGVAAIALHTRQKLIDVMASDYMLFAYARGEKKWPAVRRHGIRNIMLPAITLQFASFSELFGGSVLAEQVFSYPGLGNAATLAGLRGDAPLLLGIALCSAVFVFTGNLLANIIYCLVDPQIREERSHG